MATNKIGIGVYHVELSQTVNFFQKATFVQHVIMNGKKATPNTIKKIKSKELITKIIIQKHTKVNVMNAVENGRKNIPESYKKQHAKRYRELGFKPLNESFPGSHGHHINKKEIIYIPAELHRSVKHNVFTGEGMEEINKLAFDFLENSNYDCTLFKAQEKEGAVTGKPRNLICWEASI